MEDLPPVVASEIVECHCLTEFVVLAKLFRLLEQIKCTIDVFLFEIVDGKDVADLAELFARLGELRTMIGQSVTSLLLVPKFSFLIRNSSSSTPIASTYLDYRLS